MCARPRCSCQWAHRVRGCRRRPPPTPTTAACQPLMCLPVRRPAWSPHMIATRHLYAGTTPPHIPGPPTGPSPFCGPPAPPPPPPPPPPGPAGSVKGLTSWQLEELGCQVILGNTYHLENRPGSELVADMGGLHGFINWQRGMLTDSGGFQVRQAGSRSQPPARTVFAVCLFWQQGLF